MQIGCTTFLPGTAHSFNSLTRYEAALPRGRKPVEVQGISLDRGRLPARVERRPLNLPDALLAYTPCARCLFSEILIGCGTLL